ncbi:MAG: hypothetical protein WA705_23650 [Candidatus Ozemobacteraceae bacterium]
MPHVMNTRNRFLFKSASYLPYIALILFCISLGFSFSSRAEGVSEVQPSSFSEQKGLEVPDFSGIEASGTPTREKAVASSGVEREKVRDSAKEKEQSSIRPKNNSGDSLSEAVEVEIGMYVLDIAKLDLKENEFFADFYIWYKWKAPPMPGSAWTPENIEFMNGNVEYASKIATETLPDGRLYASQRIKGRFRGKFNLHMYPFDSQILPIIIEDSLAVRETLYFTPDSGGKTPRAWLEASVQVPDWEIKGTQAFSDIHRYETDFGYGTLRDQNRESAYSRFTFSVKLSRFFVPHFIKFIIPLMVIAGMAYVVFFINAKEFEAQCQICVTALLSAVALHISQADALPAVGYLVMADKIFILYYIVILSALVQTVMVNTYAKKNYLRTADRIDRIFRYIYPAALIIGSILIGYFTSVFT